MYFDVIISGFGGQGILFMGNLLAHAAMIEGKNVTYMTAYGPEMRGGAANCTVVMADEEIGSPLIYHPHAAVVMNRPSLYKFGARVLRGGLLVVNSSLVDAAEVSSKGVKLLLVPANDLARQAGDERLGNMVALGALVAKTGVLHLQSLIDALSEVIQERYRDLLPVNIGCLEKGVAYVRDLRSQ